MAWTTLGQRFFNLYGAAAAGLWLCMWAVFTCDSKLGRAVAGVFFYTLLRECEQMENCNLLSYWVTDINTFENLSPVSLQQVKGYSLRSPVCP